MAASVTGAVGPGHGRRRAFRSSDREHRRDVRSPRWAGLGRDAIRRRVLPHATTILPTVSGTSSSRTRLTLWHAIRHRLLSHATDFMARDPAPAPFARDRLYGTRSGDRYYRTRRPFFVRRCLAVRICPDMSGTVCHRNVRGAPVRHAP